VRYRRRRAGNRGQRTRALGSEILKGLAQVIMEILSNAPWS
jgi:hypothetical protein